MRAAVDGNVLSLTAEIVVAHAENNCVAAEELPKLIKLVHRALTTAAVPEPKQKVQVLKPAVSIKRSVFPDFIVCLEDGRKLKMLKRHLRISYGMSPDDYRTKWKLPPSYPMVAPNYASMRSDLAKDLGLGRKLPQESEVLAEVKPKRTATKEMSVRRARGSRD